MRCKHLRTQVKIYPERSIIVGHPGAQHSYQTALALQEVGILHSYLTGIYYKRENPLCRSLARIEPLRKGLIDRYNDALASDLVHVYPFWELCCLASARFPLFAKQAGLAIRLRNRYFDRKVERVVRSENPLGVLCYNSCALRTFRAAAELGSLRILDQTIGHHRTTLRLMREEAELHPDFADSIQTGVSECLLAECDGETQLAELILVGSDYARDTMVFHGVDPSCIEVIPYGADIDRFTPSENAATDRFRVLFVGQLSQRKGLKYLLEAVRALRIQDLELVLVGGVVGSGSGLARYSDCFKYMPNVPHAEVHNVFRNADIFAYPSIHEGSAIAVYEALASGLPVITTPNTGSVVKDGSEGFIVPIRDIEALKEKIVLLYRNRELRKQMGRNARAAAEQFSWCAYRIKLGSLVRDRLAKIMS